VNFFFVFLCLSARFWCLLFFSRREKKNKMSDSDSEKKESVTTENPEEETKIEENDNDNEVDDDYDSEEEEEKRKPQLAKGLVTDPAWAEQRECALLLLRARMLLRKMVAVKLYDERLNRGALSASEIHNLIKSQPEGEDRDFVAEISELKRNLMAEIRSNRGLEKQVDGLDKKIGLLIHNVGALDHQEKKKKKKSKQAETEGTKLTSEKIQIYSGLFYLLQTQPKYLARLVGCMEDSEEVDDLLETILLTLFGDATTPREEFLTLTLFKIAIEQEIKSAKSVADFVKEQSILAKMVLTYNKRKQGKDFIRTMLGPVISEFLRKDDNLELNARKIHQKLIQDQEVNSGVKSTQWMLTDDDIANLPDVLNIIQQRTKQLENACQLFLNKILSTVQRLPYGLRWICKQHRTIAQDAMPNVTELELNKMTSYFVYYRFINLGIVSPDLFGITEGKLTPQSVFNLIEVSKVLHHLFNFSLFDSRSEKWYTPMNKWMEERFKLVEHFIHDLLDVENPEDALQVDRYIELTQMVKPTIIIAVNEMTTMHRFLVDNIDRVATSGAEDKLRIILKDLGAPETYADDEREIQLTLVNRFPDAVEDAVNEGNQLFFKTKTAIISIMRQLPKPLPVIRCAGDEPTLLELLRAGSKWASSEKDEDLASSIDRVKKNIGELEKLGLVSASDGHRALLKAVTLEIANRAQIREQQNKELSRLSLALRKAGEQKKYLTEQINQYDQYLRVVRERHVGANRGRNKRGKDSGKILGPFKFTYSDLVKKHIIVESSVPAIAQRHTKFNIMSEEPGIFQVEASVPGFGKSVITLELDDLLEKQSRNLERDERDEITLDINMTIHLLNQLFRKKK